jgi:hypothetical protein
MELTLLKANCIFEVKKQKENFQKSRKNFLANPYIDARHE